MKQKVSDLVEDDSGLGKNRHEYLVELRSLCPLRLGEPLLGMRHINRYKLARMGMLTSWSSARVALSALGCIFSVSGIDMPLSLNNFHSFAMLFVWFNLYFKCVSGIWIYFDPCPILFEVSNSLEIGGLVGS